MLEVDLTRSILLTARTTALQHAVILAVRQLYNGYHTITGTAAMYALIAPWRRLDADPPGTLVTVLDAVPSGDIPETPITPTPTVVTRYLLASEDDVFSTPEVIEHSETETALQIPAGTVPAGERRFMAYGRPATLGDYDHVYFYPVGHANTLNQIGAWQQGPNLTIAGVSVRLLRARVSYSDVANGSIVEAG